MRQKPSTKREEFWEGGTINWYTPSNLTSHGHMFIDRSSRQITPDGLAGCSAALFPAGSVMMTSRATLGVVAINLEPACTNQGFITCVPNERVSASHLYFWVKSRFVRRAWAMDRSVDLVGLDSTNRIHIFELKKSSIGAQAASQLEQYLLGHVLGSADEFLAESLVQGRRQVEADRMTRYLTGAHANDRSSTVGLKKIIRELGPDHPEVSDSSGRPLTKYRWYKLTPAEQARLIHAALSRHAAKVGLGTIPTFDAVVSEAASHSHELAGPLHTSIGGCVPRPRLVIWLVGSSVQPKALEQVRLWRRSGLDARVMRVKVRHIDGRWELATRNELALKREQLENRVQGAIEIHGEPSTVRFSLYDQVSASTSLHHGGGVLAHPKAEIAWPDGRAETIEV